ncbi:hypothetical protein ACTFIW_008647 [Dictyostelium discoideum]
MENRGYKVFENNYLRNYIDNFVGLAVERKKKKKELMVKLSQCLEEKFEKEEIEYTYLISREDMAFCLNSWVIEKEESDVLISFSDICTINSDRFRRNGKNSVYYRDIKPKGSTLICIMILIIILFEENYFKEFEVIIDNKNHLTKLCFIIKEIHQIRQLLDEAELEIEIRYKNRRAKAILVFDETELIYSLQVHNGVLIGFTEQVDSSNIDSCVEKVKNIVEVNPNTYPALLKKMMANKFLMIFVVSICGTYSFPLIHKPTFKETSNSVKELVTSIINHFNQNYNVDIVGGSSDGFDTSLLLNTIPGYYHCYDMVHSCKNCRNHFNLGNFSIVHSDKSVIKFSGSALQDYYQISPEFKKIINYDAQQRKSHLKRQFKY